MSNYLFTFLRVSIFSLATILAIWACPQNMIQNDSKNRIPENEFDSSQVAVEHLLDSLRPKLFVYHKELFSIEEQGEEIDRYRKEKIVAMQDSTSAVDTLFSYLCKNKQITNKQLLMNITRLAARAQEASFKINLLDSGIAAHKSLSIDDSAFKRIQAEYNQRVQLIQKHMDSTLDYMVLKYNNISYRVYRVNTKKHNVSITPPPKSGKPSTLNSTWKFFAEKKDTPLMITNAGMYQPDFSPQGLLVTASKLVHAIDTISKPGPLNFYLQPNGVFFVDTNDKYGILSTADYRKKFLDRLPKYATQSGPLLINNGVKNRNIKLGSKNLNIRSGVGLTEKGELLFIISDTPVSFFDFAIFFSDLNCNYALYLDGAISKMFVRTDAAKLLSSKTADGEFGPMITVTAKK